MPANSLPATCKYDFLANCVNGALSASTQTVVSVPGTTGGGGSGGNCTANDTSTTDLVGFSRACSGFLANDSARSGRVHGATIRRFLEPIPDCHPTLAKHGYSPSTHFNLPRCRSTRARATLASRYIPMPRIPMAGRWRRSVQSPAYFLMAQRADVGRTCKLQRSLETTGLCACAEYKLLPEFRCGRLFRRQQPMSPGSLRSGLDLPALRKLRS